VPTIIVIGQGCSQGIRPIRAGSNSASSITGNFDTDFKTGSVLYANNCALCHGQLNVSGKAKSSVQLITAAVRTVPQMSNLSFLSSKEIELISLALAGPTQVITTGNKTLFACDVNAVRKSSILKLSNREFANSLSTLLNDFSASTTSPLSNDTQLQSLFAALPSDISTLAFTAKENSFFLSSKIVSVSFDSIYRAAVLVSTATTGLTNYPNTSQCLAAATITQACHQSFVRELASRAFRRTVSTTEGNALATSIWNSTLSKADLLIETFATVASYPDFIYKAYNTGADENATSVAISGVELANKLSFFLTGAPASAALRTLAASGGLDNAATFKAEVDKMIASTAGQASLRRLFRESYGYDVNGDLQYNANVLSGYSTQNLQTAMVQELDHYFTNEVITKKAKFQDLMTSKESLVTQASLGQIYGVSANANASTILSEDRSGFITRAALLTKKSGYYTSPVKRGRYVMEQVLCDSVGDPPANVNPQISEDQVVGQLTSTRTRYENLTEQANTTCVGCHSKINHYGYALEAFDTLGRKRTVESIFNTTTGQILGTTPVNTAGTIKANVLIDSTPVSNATDMAIKFGTSDMAIMCFTRHVKAFDIRQPASTQDFCHMNESLNVLYGTNGNQGTVYDAIIAYVTSKEFKTWKY